MQGLEFRRLEQNKPSFQNGFLATLIDPLAKRSQAKVLRPAGVAAYNIGAGLWDGLDRSPPQN